MSFPELDFCYDFDHLGESFFSRIGPSPLHKPHWIHINPDLAREIGSTTEQIHAKGLGIFSGQENLPGQSPKAMVYAGHQFGGYSPQLGDGRALLIAQLKTPKGFLDLQLKGAGKTPYSRFGDGRAVLRSSIREYLAGEAIHALGIDTTRALCLVGSEEPVMRETMETGAMITRTARTHIRFGNFEFFHYQNRLDELDALVAYVVEHFVDQSLREQYNNPAEALFINSVISTAKMIAQWQAAGFAHGVMNTDNMSIIGETLDYGPYGFLDDYEPGFICNHSDTTGRYAFEQQPGVALWNLNALGHALSSQLDREQIKKGLQAYEPRLNQIFSQEIRKKLGLMENREEDQQLSAGLLSLMAEEKTDYHHCFRVLSEFDCRDTQPKIRDLFRQTHKIERWCEDYRQRLKKEPGSDSERQAAMKAVNPKFVARNYLLQEAIEKAQAGNYSEIDTLFKLLQNPFDDHPGFENYASPPLESGKHLSVSCSS